MESNNLLGPSPRVLNHFFASIFIVASGILPDVEGGVPRPEGSFDRPAALVLSKRSAAGRDAPALRQAGGPPLQIRQRRAELPDQQDRVRETGWPGVRTVF